MKKVEYLDLGLIDYKQAWDYQTGKHKELVDRKMRNRDLLKQGLSEEEQLHYLIFCEHLPVYTLGKSGSLDHLLLDEDELAEQGFQFYKINRGGDITYHGPGQIVGYPIFDLECFFTDVHKYVRFLEEVVIRTLDHYGLEGIRMKGYTGVWLAEQDWLPKRKICAIGVHLSRWVTMHGFAFNINTQINHFNNIIPCGIEDKDKAVTSLQQEIDREVDIEEVKNILKKHFAELFDFDWIAGKAST
jgi:lipoyl(octanoyl) transferase